MTTEISETGVNRRYLLRGGAVLAGAAGIAAIGAVKAPSASAADGQFAVVGQPNTEESSMTLRIDGVAGGPDAALQLLNANGPSLELEALDSDWDGDLEIGEILNTTTGPLVGLEDFEGEPATGYLATNFDLDMMPITFPVLNERLVDTRSPGLRAGIVQSSTAAFDASGRLKAGAWMDIAVAPTEELFTFGAFVNLLVVGPLASGYAFAYYPDTRPLGSSVNFARGETVSNAAFVALGVVGDYFAFRVFTRATTHVVVDLSGLVASSVPGPGSGVGARVAARQGRRAGAARRRIQAVGKSRR